MTQTQEVLKPFMQGIDHVGIAVPDLDVAIQWHRTVLGLEVTHREQNPEQGVEEAMLGVAGATSDTVLIQLLAPLTPDSTIATFIDRKGPGLQQLAFRVSDIAAASAALTDHGVRLLYPAPKRGTADSQINFIHPKDAGGVLIELVQSA